MTKIESAMVVSSDQRKRLEPGDSGWAAGQSIVIALESSECFVFWRKAEQMRQLRKRSLLVYELENFLPLDGEDLSVDVVRHGSEGALIVAADGQAISSLVDELEAQGVYTRAVVPMVVLAIERLARDQDIQDIEVVVWTRAENVDLVRLQDGKIRDWRWVTNDSSIVTQTIEQLTEAETSEDLPKILVCDDTLSASLSEAGIRARNHIANQEELASQEAAAIASGEVGAPIDPSKRTA